MDIRFDEASFSGEVPLFPLPGVVLLPGGVLPLHVFEPRYREMVRDARQGERLIGVALLAPGYEADYEGNPAIEPTVCIGRMVSENELPDGRWILLLVGLRRARVVREDWTRPYRVAAVEPLPDRDLLPGQPPPPWRELQRLLEEVPSELVTEPARLQVVLQGLSDPAPELPPGVLLDLAADALELGVRDRLALLTTPEVPERARLLGDLVLERTRQLADKRAAMPWPPRFSRN